MPFREYRNLSIKNWSNLAWSDASRSFFYLVFGLNQIQIAGGDVYSVAFVLMNIHFTESFINNNERVLDIDVGEARVTFEDCPAVGLEPLRVEIYKRQPRPNKYALPDWDGVKRMPPEEQRAVYVVV